MQRRAEGLKSAYPIRVVSLRDIDRILAPQRLRQLGLKLGVQTAGAASMEPVPFIDNPLLRFLGHFAHRSEAFDTFVVTISKLDLFKGAAVLSIVCWLWFEVRSHPEKRMLVIQTVVGGAFAGLISRVLQLAVARPRPMNAASEYVRPFGISDVDVEWMKSIHSFPSDHAAFFAAIAMGIFLIDRRWGIFAFVWMLIVTDLPRVYVGLHYPSDVLAGLALGVLVTLAMRKPARILAGPLLRWEKTHAGFFYSLSFLGLYEMARLFDEIRILGAFLWNSARGALV
jgi:membrane-associated phospholipid phosphatase